MGKPLPKRDGQPEAPVPSFADGGISAEELILSSQSLSEGLLQTTIFIPDMHCGGCIQKVERGLGALDGVEGARVNLSTKRAIVKWKKSDRPLPLLETLRDLGFNASLVAPETGAKDRTMSELVRALAVAGFGASNIMLLSVSIWSGAEPAMRDLFHWISALIALPVLAYSGRVFFRSAWGVLKHGKTNMDVPISIGVLLAFGLSFFDTIKGTEHAYFDAAVMLLFFLLIGRTLDHMMRERARVAVKNLMRLAARSAQVLHDDGSHEYVSVSKIQKNMRIGLAVGERVPVDGIVDEGQSDFDCSLVTGESVPQPKLVGALLQAGTLNLTSPVVIRATATEDQSFLAQMTRLLEAAEMGRSGYRRIADRAASLYAPFVHTAAFLGFLVWLFVTGDFHQSLTIAVAVLIITCPCALGLAVPMVQIVAARRLFEKMILIKDGSVLEKLCDIDSIVFDKTGTLTLGQPELSNKYDVKPLHLSVAAAMAKYSRHPFAQAIIAANDSQSEDAIAFTAFTEVAGFGLEATSRDDIFRLGRTEWALGKEDGLDEIGAGSKTILTKNGVLLDVFRFSEVIRPGVRELIRKLTRSGLEISILSGDDYGAVEKLATELNVSRFEANMHPKDKVDFLNAMTARGRKVLMVGDGLNDVPALATAHVSMVPGNAADIGRDAADIVFLDKSLEAVSHILNISHRANSLIQQNFGFAIVYNVVALPFAFFGIVTPLVAAVAMSASSILVVANALRLGRKAASGHIVSSTSVKNSNALAMKREGVL